MTLRPPFFFFLLLLSFLQPWRLAASTPGAENFLKHVTEEGICLIDEVTREEGSINHHSPLDVEQRVAQTEPRTTEEEASVEPSPMDTKISGNQILALPGGIIFNFLRSPEAKQAAYKADHQQTVQELQSKYPDLTDKITAWKQALEEWSECPISAEKEIRYQQVEALAPDMPPELYRLGALSLAMKIIEDAKAYTHYLPLAWEKYDQNRETEEEKTTAARSKIIFLTQIDTINNNIEKLEKAADAVIRLSEQKNRCLASAAIATKEEEEENVDIAEQFQAAAKAAKEAITSYCEFGQKMKQGDVPSASLLRIKGFSLECMALEKDYDAQSAVSGDSTQKDYFLNATFYFSLAAESLENAFHVKSLGKIKEAKAFEQAAQYHFQAAQDIENHNNTKKKKFSSAARSTRDAAETLNQADQARNHGYIEIAKAYEQIAHYRFQAAQAIFNEDSTMAENFSNAAYETDHAAKSLENASHTRSEDKEEVTKAFKQAAQHHLQAAQYYLQAIQTPVNGNSTMAENFSAAASNSSSAAAALKKAALAKSVGKVKNADTYEQEGYYYFKTAQTIIDGDSTKAENFLKAAYNASQAATPLKNADEARCEGKEEAAKAYEQVAQYYLQASKAAANGDNTKEKNFLKAASHADQAATSLKNAAQAKSENKTDVAKTH